MRTAFMESLTALAADDPRITLVVGDLGFSVVEAFASKHPSGFVNAGVAEQSMTGIAAGMALTGRVVFTYSIANFTTVRCLEQVRDDVCYHGLDVKIVSVGGGLAYGSLGYTHHASEDLAIMRALPGITVVAPADPVEAAAATRAAVEQPGPFYLRLGKAGEPVVHRSAPSFEVGKAITVREGNDLTLISTGGMLHTAVEVAGRLAEDGLEARVLSMHTVKPIDSAATLAAAQETRAVITLEEHSITAGLGGAVAEVMAESASGHARLLRLGLRPELISEVGDQQQLRRLHGLDSDSVLASVRQLLEERSGRVR